MKTFDLGQMDVGTIYRLMISAIVPRPIAWVSTVNDRGVGNLAPFSYFNAVSSDPATLSFSIAMKPNGSKKDTLLNIEKNKQFVVNIANEALIQQVNQTSADYEYGVDELEKAGLTALPSILVKPFRVKESPVQMECEFYDSLTIGNGGAGTATLVVGKILTVHVDEAVLDPARPGNILIEQLRPIARLGGISYSTIGQVIDLPRHKI